MVAEIVKAAKDADKTVIVEHPQQSNIWDDDWASSTTWHGVNFNAANVDNDTLAKGGKTNESCP